MRDILVYLKHVPDRFKSGPWCFAAYAYIFLYFAGLVHFHDKVDISEVELLNTANIPSWIPCFQLWCSIYCFVITGVLLYNAGPLPLTSYTMTSWNLLTLRLFMAYLGSQGYDWAFVLSQKLLFPALVGCSITCTVWWLILTPLISTLLKSNRSKDHKAFWEWNTSFMLLNLHGLMVILAAIDFTFAGRQLVAYDLWISLLVAFIYVLFYLFVLDPRGLHFYIILTPRTSYCIISYSAILLTYYGCYIGWQAWYSVIHHDAME